MSGRLGFGRALLDRRTPAEAGAAPPGNERSGTWAYGIAMDDFGTGYTSLALLSQLPLDERKLDRAFVMRVHQRHDRVIVGAVTRMADQLGLVSVAEGVEDEQTAQTLAKIGNDVTQVQNQT